MNRVVILLLALTAATAAWARDVTVAQDGSGDFRTVQAAVDSVPADNHERVIVLVKAGTYREQVRIHPSYITLRGEGRDKTRIEAEIDTSGACPTTPQQSKEEVCATVIADGHDEVFENLTIANTFRRATHGKGAALSIVGDATHAIVAHADIVGYGGDTFVFSARRNRMGDGGEYYANDVSVSGTYHIIVPRGTAYVTNSRFQCVGGERICLFAEGITRETDKLVIRDSTIDGTEPFGLGSYFRDAAWYFVNDKFSDQLKADGAIFRNPAKDYVVKWGEGRIYFAGIRGPDYPWLKDNIATSPAKTAAAVTAKWVFPEWDPESTEGPKVKEVRREGSDVRITFSESVTVRGKPRVRGVSGSAEYVSGSGSDTLLFRGSVDGRPQSFFWNGGAIVATAASLHERRAERELPAAR